MDDSFPIPARTGVARGPLDPTAVTPGPQPLDVSERSGPNVIVGEVLQPGRHRATRPRRKVALSGAVLSAAGAVVTLALMIGNGGSHTASAAPRSVPSSPLPDLPDEPVAAQHPEHTPAPPAPTRAARRVPVTTTVAHTPPPVRPATLTPQQQLAQAAAQWRAQMRRDAARDAQVWATAMRQAAATRDQHGYGYGYGSTTTASSSYQSADRSNATTYGAQYDSRHGGHRRGRG